MWFLGPFLIIWVMVKFWRLTVTLFVLGVTAAVLVQHPFWGYALVGLEVSILIFVLRIREQDDHAREAVNLQRRVEADLDRRDRVLENGRAGRARAELQAELIARELIREARRGPR